MKPIRALVAGTALIALGATSCIKDDNGGTVGPTLPDNAFFNFATYNGSKEGQSSFTVQREGDAGSATITFGMAFNDQQLKPGTRTFISYTTATGQQYVSGPGTLYSCANVDGGDPVEATAANSVRLSAPIKLQTATRTGDYLNVTFEVPMNRRLLSIALTEAPNLKDPAYPVVGLYLVSDVEEGAWHQARVSFDIDDVLDEEGVKGVRFAYRGDTGLDTLTFNKTNSGTITPIN
ncbi:MAG: hypothetical protein K2M12_08295 [Muribaculaceae bacterium]|nr:hypothetical protein [Muribaculaceae bacterium]